MITKQKIVFYCEHCNKNGLQKWRMERHEKYCRSNPDNNHKCWDCKHLGISILHKYSCQKQNMKELFSAKYFELFGDKNKGKLGSIMPKECDLFEQSMPRCQTNEDGTESSLFIPFNVDDIW